MTYRKNVFGSQIIYLQGAFFGILITASGAELWSNNSGASSGWDFLILDWNNYLLTNFKPLYIIIVIHNLIIWPQIHLMLTKNWCWKVWGKFRMRYPHFKGWHKLTLTRAPNTWWQSNLSDIINICLQRQYNTWIFEMGQFWDSDPHF